MEGLRWRNPCSGRWEAASPKQRALLPFLEPQGHYNFPEIKQDMFWNPDWARVKIFEAIYF